MARKRIREGYMIYKQIETPNKIYTIPESDTVYLSKELAESTIDQIVDSILNAGLVNRHKIETSIPDVPNADRDAVFGIVATFIKNNFEGMSTNGWKIMPNGEYIDINTIDQDAMDYMLTLDYVAYYKDENCVKFMKDTLIRLFKESPGGMEKYRKYIKSKYSIRVINVVG